MGNVFAVEGALDQSQRTLGAITSWLCQASRPQFLHLINGNKHASIAHLTGFSLGTHDISVYKNIYYIEHVAAKTGILEI